MNKPIVINEKNKDRITAELDTLQKKCSVRTISFQAILSCCNKVEERIGLPKKYLKGVRISVDPYAQTFPNAYKYTPESTQFDAVHTGKEWKLIKLYRSATRGPKLEFIVVLTEEAKKEVLLRLEHFSRYE